MSRVTLFEKTSWTSKKPSDTFCNLLLICILLAVTVLSVYWQVVGFDFINFDDLIYVKNNNMVREGITLKGIIWAFTSVGYASNWHPLTWISHMLDVQLFGMNPGMHHFTNVIIHTFNTLLLFFVFERMTGAVWRSAVIAMLFALHPLHVESVAWIAERKDVLGTFFWLITMICYYWYVRHCDIKRYLIVIICYILGLLSKPMLVTLPFVLLLLDYWPLNRLEPIVRDEGSNSKQNERMVGPVIKWPMIKPLITEKIPLITLAVIASCMTIFAQHNDQAIYSLQELNLSLRILNAISSYTAYLEKMVFPFNLAVFYPYPTIFHLYMVIPYSVLLLMITTLVLFFVRSLPYLAIGWFWYLGTLIPVIGIVQVGDQSMADRYTYIPLIGIFLIGVWGLGDLISKWRYGEFALRILPTALLLLLMWVTWIQVGQWKNSEILYRHALHVTRNNFLAHYNLGVTLFDKGDVDGAIKQYKDTLKINPHISGAHNNLGIIMFRIGNYTQAIYHFSAALKINPYQAEVYNNLGGVYYCKGNIKKAIECFRNATQDMPDYTIAAQKLNIAQNDQKNIDNLISWVRGQLKQEPNNPALYIKLGDIYRQQEDFNEAMKQYQMAVSLEPKSIPAMNGLALIYTAQQEYTKAVDLLLRIRQIQPDNAETYYNIACIYAKQNMSNQSIVWLKQSIEKGFHNWDLIRNDPNLDNIRSTAFINELIKKH